MNNMDQSVFCVTCTIYDIYENTEPMRYETYVVASNAEQARRGAMTYWRGINWVHEITINNVRWVHVPIGQVMSTKRIK